ncbi:MAG: hypothetical protein K8F25_15665 [Fimbriimonadaceae bacterium]|nr:hypothetical protein [Alphaproteobacteria bacterium]
MSFPGSILMGAQTRLLDPTIPYRYFAAALLFHILLWGLIALNPDEITFFAGGFGPALAALHSLTLGVLVMTAMGAAFQMLPVATGKPLRSTAAARIASWFFIPGVVVLVWGMYIGSHIPMALGGIATIIGLLIFIALIGELLWHARAMGPVSNFGLLALGALLVTLILGFGFIVDDDHGIMTNRFELTGLHLVAAIFGFMGMLAAGFSHVLIPLFTLAQGVPAEESRAVFILAVVALLAAGGGIYFDWSGVVVIAGLTALAGAGLHIRSMERCLTSGMRKKIGVASLLIRLGWACLVISLVAATLTAAGYLDDYGIRMVIFIAPFGWLLTFMLGVLQRILPFLGAMNSTGAGSKPPRPSELAPEKVLRFQAVSHVIALVTVSVGLVLEDPLPVRFGAIAGLFSALIYAAFALRIWWLIHGRPQKPI